MPCGSQPVRSEIVNVSSGRSRRTRATTAAACSGSNPMAWKPSPFVAARR